MRGAQFIHDDFRSAERFHMVPGFGGSRDLDLRARARARWRGSLAEVRSVAPRLTRPKMAGHCRTRTEEMRGNHCVVSLAGCRPALRAKCELGNFFLTKEI